MSDIRYQMPDVRYRISDIPYLASCILIVFFLLSCHISQSQTDSAFLSRKTIQAVRISKPPKIDGKLDEPFWKTLPVASDFVEYNPRNGTHPPFKTEVRFAYDDDALYAAGIMYDPSPDSIFRQLGRRDMLDQLANDYLSFDILPYDDEMNMYEFKVNPAGVQNDCKYSMVGQDISWDAVWESATSINDSCWILEIKLPYSALRFPKIEKQVWGINMWRNFYRRQEYSTWSWVDNNTQNIFKYYGRLVGMNNIKPPVRLSFVPYVSSYIQKDPSSKGWSYEFRGGMDLRYGINESYTLDMMLIPDFGQVQSDDLILNLTPFEVKYIERRQFFTEATEMFSKCDIFYTRRVGGPPKYGNVPYDSAKSSEVITKNPDETRIINATKISGRNQKGLGIGFFNAMTTNTWATLEDTVKWTSRKLMTQPFTNYNVLVVDQNLKNHSYITLINTNYWIPDRTYSANVTGFESSISNKKNTFSVFGRLNVSQLYQLNIQPVFGHQYVISISKPSGKFQFDLGRQETGDHYDPNDMGFLLYNNDVVNQLNLYYLILKPTWKLINNTTTLTVRHTSLYNPGDFKSLSVSLQNQCTFTNYWNLYLQAGIVPLGYNDYYEPRVWGWVFKSPLSYTGSFRFGTDSRKMFRYAENFTITSTPGNNNLDYTFEYIPRLRLSDRIQLSLDLYTEKNLNNYGWVETSMDSMNNTVIYFGRRDITTWNNIIQATYIFNTKMSLSLRLRHYWSQAKYLQYYTLNRGGNLDYSNYNKNNNIDFNAFSVDLQYIWYFAPGSEISIVWKNQILSQGTEIQGGYFTNLGNTLGSPQTNSFSIRVLYYLDYAYLKKWFGKKKSA
ncbi:MAG: DUF5916 domain-containing protein [Bacteroidetes bacterium]|nr:DUF5916 domain-containing protein [Bacteroidota bacterium]